MFLKVSDESYTKIFRCIHVYGGDFFHDENRSEWDPENLTEQEHNAENVKNVLEAFSST